jgi:hypothetical protein
MHAPKVMAAASFSRWTTILLVNVGLFAAFLGAAELAMRFAYPCDPAKNSWHWRFVPGIGEIYESNSLVRHSNRFDYCVEQRANGLGFLDRDPPVWEAVKDKLRVAIVGDSVVEATQVPLADKVQIELEKLLGAGGTDAYVSAYGISGLGQVQELALFKKFGLALHPQVVVLVVVGNDLKNNSWLLEAISAGFSPDTPYDVEIQPPDWHIIYPVPIADVKRLPKPPRSAPVPSWSDWLWGHSALYAFALHHAAYQWPMIHGLIGGRAPDDPTLFWIDYLSRDPALAPLLAGWPRDGAPIGKIFEYPDRPLAFDFAIRATEYVMDEWVALAAREHFRLIALMRNDFDEVPGQASAWRHILAERNIPTIWHADFLRSRGYDQDSSHFRRDGHWSPLGHRWAAEAIADSLKSAPAAAGLHGRP